MSHSNYCIELHHLIIVIIWQTLSKGIQQRFYPKPDLKSYDRDDQNNRSVQTGWGENQDDTSKERGFFLIGDLHTNWRLAKV